MLCGRELYKWLPVLVTFCSIGVQRCVKSSCFVLLPGQNLEQPNLGVGFIFRKRRLCAIPPPVQEQYFVLKPYQL